MIKEQSTAKGFAFMSTANLICRCLSILYIPILTRFLGDVGNGIYSAGYTVFTLLFEITYMGIPVAISRMVAKYNAEKRYFDSLRTFKFAAGLLVLLGLICGGVMAVFCRPIADKILDTKDAWMTILLLSPAILFSSFSGAIRGFFQGQKNMTYTSVSQIIEQVLNAITTPLLAYLFIEYAKGQGMDRGMQLVYGAGGGALGTFLGALGSSLYLLFVLGRHYKPIKAEANKDYIENKTLLRESNMKLVKIIISTAIPIVLGAAMVYLANLIDVSFIKRRLVAAGFADENLRNTIYGIFSTQYHKTTNIVLGIAATLPATILPGISQVAAKNDKSLLERKMKNSVRASFLITMPCCAGLAILANPIIYLLFPGNRVTPVAGVADPHVLIISGVWSIIIVSIVQVMTSILQGTGDFKTAPINMTIGLAVKLALNYLLISTKLNIMGAIISTYVCYLLVLALDYAAVVRRTGIKLNLPGLSMRPLLATAVMAAVVFGIMYGVRYLLIRTGNYAYITNAVLAAVCVAVGGLTYFIFALKFRAIDKGDLSTVPIVGGFLKKPFMTRFVNKLVK